MAQQMTQATPQTADGAAVTAMPMTVAHLVLIAVVAVIVVIGILYGARLKRRRTAGERQVANDASALQDAAPAALDPASTTADASAGTPPEREAPASPLVGPEQAPGSASQEHRVPTPAPAAAGGELTQIKGLGPRIAARLAEEGIGDVAQLAALGPDEAAALDARLGTFAGRMARDRWIEQARLLAAGDRAGFEAEFGKMG